MPGSPYGIAIDDARGDALGHRRPRNNRVVGLELTDLAPKRVVSLRRPCEQPNTVAVDSGTGFVYVAGRAKGELQAIDPQDRRRRR